MASLLPRPARPGKPAGFRGSFLRFSTPWYDGLFRPRAVHETKRDENETISGVGEDIRKLAMVINPTNE
ncbi:hypothetical protein ACWAUC_18250 [Bradyrhizobium guangdongense]